MVSSPPPPAPIRDVATIAETVEAISTIIDWSIAAPSRLGYFAALYKRITTAVGTAIEQGAFQDGPRMQRFDATFAMRYFDAINGHFYPERFPAPTRSWQAAFDVAEQAQPIILQHMLTGVNAHILLDLGIAAREVSPRLSTLHPDFNTINAVLASQVNGVVDEINSLSPALADVYAVLQQQQIFVINEAVRDLRDSAWRFASLLAVEPSFLRPATIWLRDRQVAGQDDLISNPLASTLLDTVADQESRDIAHNLRVLDEIVSAPAPIQTAL